MDTLVIEAPIRADGSIRLNDLQMRIEREQVEVEVEDESPTPVEVRPDVPIIVQAYEHLRSDSATRTLMEILPGGSENGLTPEELGRLFDPPLSKASVRAVIRNSQRLERNLGLEKETLFPINFKQYSSQGAGRYHLHEADRAALDTHLGR